MLRRDRHIVRDAPDTLITVAESNYWSHFSTELFLSESYYLDIGQTDKYERLGKPGSILLMEHILI